MFSSLPPPYISSEKDDKSFQASSTAAASSFAISAMKKGEKRKREKARGTSKERNGEEEKKKKKKKAKSADGLIDWRDEGEGDRELRMLNLSPEEIRQLEEQLQVCSYSAPFYHSLPIQFTYLVSLEEVHSLDLYSFSFLFFSLVSRPSTLPIIWSLRCATSPPSIASLVTLDPPLPSTPGALLLRCVRLNFCLCMNACMRVHLRIYIYI